uniref:hypothetical protein n=1 Tax=uncultured Sphingomonas sp. TaxID=158754 RepID=UPI0025E0C042|nr:hypothetical protein [uncultured Sphingomonas sp.]
MSRTPGEVPAIILVEAERPVPLDGEPVELARQPKQQRRLGSALELLRQGTAVRTFTR